ncbi:MAG: HAD-IA family hydrolase [Chloroflexota bacterium]|nr:HAD-IA family hydrolase [Chloroflexota bacterium]
MRAVAFDAMGVLYRSGDDIRDILVPFARARGSAASDDDIRAAYRRASLGAATSAELWTELGVAGDAAELDATYVRGLEVTLGIAVLIDELRAQGIVVGCISNDIVEWSLAARRAHGIDARVDYWTISGAVRSRKPQREIYLAFLEQTGLGASDVVFVDDRAVNVEAAAAFGFDAILVDFGGVGSSGEALRTVAALRSALVARRQGPQRVPLK